MDGCQKIRSFFRRLSCTIRLLSDCGTVGFNLYYGALKRTAYKWLDLGFTGINSVA